MGSSGSTLIPGLWPPPDRSVFRVWVPVYFVSGGTFHVAYLLRGCGASTPQFSLGVVFLVCGDFGFEKGCAMGLRLGGLSIDVLVLLREKLWTILGF